MHSSKAIVLFCAVIAAGCASTPPGNDQPTRNSSASQPPSFLRFAGDPVQQVDFTRLSNWQSMGRDHVVLSLARDRHVLIKLLQPCITDVRQARSLGLERAIGNTLRLQDSLRIDDTSCSIESMRMFDLRAFRERDQNR